MKQEKDGEFLRNPWGYPQPPKISRPTRMRIKNAFLRKPASGFYTDSIFLSIKKRGNHSADCPVFKFKNALI